MSQCNFESAVKQIPYDQDTVYNRLSDLNNLSMLRDALCNPAVESVLKEKMAPDQLSNIQTKLREMQFDADSVRVNADMLGEIGLRVIEREAPKCVKFEIEGAPFAANMWIQLLPQGENECKMRITVRADINMFIKGMVSKPIQQGVDGLAETLARLPYGGNL